MATTAHHRVVIVGGGTAGISVAARLIREIDDVAVIEPSDKHYYQPLWTLVGGGCAKASTSERAESSVMLKRVQWIKDAVTAFDPENNTVTALRSSPSGDYLLAGLQNGNCLKISCSKKTSSQFFLNHSIILYQ